MSAVNKELVALFEDMAQLLEQKGELIFKIRAYRRAAEIIADSPHPLDAPAQQDQELMKVPGIGKAISGKILEYIATGQVAAYERLKAEFPGHKGVPTGVIVDCTNYFKSKGLIPSRSQDTLEDDAVPNKGGQAH